MKEGRGRREGRKEARKEGWREEGREGSVTKPPSQPRYTVSLAWGDEGGEGGKWAGGVGRVREGKVAIIICRRKKEDRQEYFEFSDRLLKNVDWFYISLSFCFVLIFFSNILSFSLSLSLSLKPTKPAY